MRKLMTFLFLLITFSAISQAPALQSGPMLGYAEMREAVVWLQTTGAARVYATYDNLSTEMDEALKTDTVHTNGYRGYSAKLYFTNLQAGTEYKYSIFINDKAVQLPYPLTFKTQSNWAFRKDPPDFKIALGSCTYVNEEAYDRGGNPYGDQYGIFNSILNKKPDAMLWLGDNTYLRPGDWWTRSGYIHRYTHTRSLPQMQELLAACNHFAIWDDHDYGPNDANGSWVQKDLALEVFQTFWVNHTYGTADLPGVHSAFQYADVDFFLMDNRFYRTDNFNKGEKHIFGKEQTELLINRLKASRASFKVVATGGQFLNSAAVFENHAYYPEERNYILKRINEEEIKGVVFLSGDRHASEMMEMELPNGHKIWEFTVSPLTSGPANNEAEDNDFRIKGSYLAQRNFAILEFKGPLKERLLTITYFDSEGNELQKHSISLTDVYK